jgi:hypothetical protein
LLVLKIILPIFSQATSAYIPGRSSPRELPVGLAPLSANPGIVIETLASVTVPPSLPFLTISFGDSISDPGDIDPDSNPLSQIQNKAYKCL